MPLYMYLLFNKYISEREKNSPVVVKEFMFYLFKERESFISSNHSIMNSLKDYKDITHLEIFIFQLFKKKCVVYI